MKRFGSVDQLPSGRYRARYTGPDGKQRTAKTREGKPLTFAVEGEAWAYLALRQSEILRDKWLPPEVTTARRVTLADYATPWLKTRKLAISTRQDYEGLLSTRILPTLGPVAIPDITPAMVRLWNAEQNPDTPRRNAAAYALLRTILNTAVDDDIITANPCKVRGAGTARTQHRPRPATLDQLDAIKAALPAAQALTVDLACWCSLRVGEVLPLRRRDIDLDTGRVHVARAVTRVRREGLRIKDTKSDAGMRWVTIPPHILPAIADHLERHTQPGPDGLLFTADDGEMLTEKTLHNRYVKARAAAGRPDLKFHDLRHTGQTYAAAMGASLVELMARAGQSTQNAALRYLHEIDGRQDEIAARLAAFATGTDNVTPIRGRRAN